MPFWWTFSHGNWKVLYFAEKPCQKVKKILFFLNVHWLGGKEFFWFGAMKLHDHDAGPEDTESWAPSNQGNKLTLREGQWTCSDYRICQNKRPRRLIFRSNKKTIPKPIKPHRFCVLPPLKTHPSKSISFKYSPLWKITVFGGRLFWQVR